MARQLKDCRPFTIRMERNVFERLELFCNESGQSKTLATERAICMYIDDYYKRMEKLHQIEK